MCAALVDSAMLGDRLLRARFRLAHGAHLTVLLCYAPTDVPGAEVMVAADSFYQQLSRELAALPRREVVVVLGDFNAGVGTDAAGAWRGVMGRFGGDRFKAECGLDGRWRYQLVERTPSPNGVRLLDLAAQHGLVLANTHAQGLRFGQDFDNLEDLPLIEQGTTVTTGTIHSSYSEDSIELNGVWSTDTRLCLEAASPRPCTVLAAVITGAGHDKV